MKKLLMSLFLLLATVTCYSLGPKLWDQSVLRFGKSPTDLREIYFDRTIDADSVKLSSNPTTDQLTIFTDQVSTGKATDENLKWVFDIGSGAGNPFVKWDTTDKKLKFSHDGTKEDPFGTGGGGQYKNFLNDENPADASAWTSGSNVIFDNGGTAAADFIVITSSLIDTTDESNYQLTQIAGSLDDWFYEQFSVDEQITNGIKFHYSYDGADDDIEITAKCVTSSEIIYTEKIKQRTEKDPFTDSILIPSGCGDIRFGYHIDVENIGAVFKLNRLQLNNNPFVYKNVNVEQFMRLSGGTQTGSSTATITNHVMAENSGSDTGIFSEHTSGVFTVNKRSRITISYEGTNDGAADATIFARKLPSTVLTGDSQTGSGLVLGNSVTVLFEPGETFDIRGDDLSNSKLIILAVAESDNYLTPSKVPKTYSQLNGDFTVTSTGTGWVTDTALIVPYITGDGSWRAKGNIEGSLSASSASHVLTISGLIFNADLIQVAAVSISASSWGVGATTENTGDININAGVATTGFRTSFDMALKSKPLWASSATANYMATTPKDRFQTKLLASNITSNTADVTDLKYSNLTIGDYYKVTVQHGATLASGNTGSTLTALNNSVTVCKSGIQDAAAAIITEIESFSCVFKASATSLVFDWQESGTATLEGDGTRDFTFVQLEKRQYIETSEW